MDVDYFQILLINVMFYLQSVWKLECANKKSRKTNTVVTGG